MSAISHRRKFGIPFQKGNQASKGKGRGSSPTALTVLKLQLISRTGMLPLDFMTAVYRDELYDNYVERLLEEGKTKYFEPAPEAKKIIVTLDQRISCAAHAAAYIHKKMPVGIEMKDRNTANLHSSRLAGMSVQRLTELLEFMDSLGVAADIARLPATFENGSAQPSP